MPALHSPETTSHSQECEWEVPSCKVKTSNDPNKEKNAIHHGHTSHLIVVHGNEAPQSRLQQKEIPSFSDAGLARLPRSDEDAEDQANNNTVDDSTQVKEFSDIKREKNAVHHGHTSRYIVYHGEKAPAKEIQQHKEVLPIPSSAKRPRFSVCTPSSESNWAISLPRWSLHLAPTPFSEWDSTLPSWPSHPDPQPNSRRGPDNPKPPQQTPRSRWISSAHWNTYRTYSKEY